jgi:molybdopterin-guanine dinucleotide biosynthesis protein A
MTENTLSVVALSAAIIIYGISMISLAIYAVRLANKLHEYEEQSKAERLKHLLEHHAPTPTDAPLLGAVYAAPKTKAKKGTKNA